MPKGGPRPGAGRPPGTRTRRDPETNATLAELARVHTGAALQALAEIASHGRSESARVSAAIALLDRGHGRPAAPGETAPVIVIKRAW